MSDAADKASIVAKALLLSPLFDGLFGPTVKVSFVAGAPVSVTCAPRKEIGVPAVYVPVATVAPRPFVTLYALLPVKVIV